MTNFIRPLKDASNATTQAEKPPVELLTTHTYEAVACVGIHGEKNALGTCMTTAIIKDAQVMASASSSQCGSEMTTSVC